MVSLETCFRFSLKEESLYDDDCKGRNCRVEKTEANKILKNF